MDRLTQLRNSAPAVLPSLLMCDFGNLEREVSRLEQAGVKCLHLDVMDGNFVPNISYGFPIVEALRRLTDMTLDVHLMIQRPEKYISQFIDAGSDIVTIHVEATDDPVAALENIRSQNVASGLALNPDTPLDTVEQCMDACDLILVMSVNAGFGGQTFNPIALEKLKRLNQIKPSNILLEVDGGVNRETIGECVAAGAELLVVGSAIFKQPDYNAAVEQLGSLMQTNS